jgi:hypothetical protein
MTNVTTKHEIDATKPCAAIHGAVSSRQLSMKHQQRRPLASNSDTSRW